MAARREARCPCAVELTYAQIDDDVLAAAAPPRTLLLRRPGACWRRAWPAFVSAWIYQVRTGMGVAGISHPVGWGVYIANFVFWVGIAHSGTLISAILHLVRAQLAQRRQPRRPRR